MNILSWVLALSLMVGAFYEAIVFYQASLCRQMAWLKSTESLTRFLIPGSPALENFRTHDCKLIFKRFNGVVKWHSLHGPKRNSVELNLKGSL